MLYWSALRPHGHGGHGRDDDDKVVKHRSWERAPRHFQDRADELEKTTWPYINVKDGLTLVAIRITHIIIYSIISVLYVLFYWGGGNCILCNKCSKHMCFKLCCN